MVTIGSSQIRTLFLLAGDGYILAVGTSNFTLLQAQVEAVSNVSLVTTTTDILHPNRPYSRAVSMSLEQPFPI